MGCCVKDYVDPNECFCISYIDSVVMQKVGLNITKSKLRELARNSKPFGYVWTGAINPVLGNQKRTKIYRYKDFLSQIGK